MKAMDSLRVLWLLNHTTLRAFEIAQLNRLGIKEVFLPKFFPSDEGNLSASVDHSQDQYLTIPKNDLDLLNAQNWYKDPTPAAWKVASKYFDIAVIGFFPEQIQSAVAHFNGAIVMRVFGLSKGYSYTSLLDQIIGRHGIEKIKNLKSRFWFGAGYEHLHEVEGNWLQKRNCYLPVGLKNVDLKDSWTGDNSRILFVCPRINSSGYFKQIYQQFIQDFSGFQFTIAGAQPVPVDDERVIGYVSDDIHRENMRKHRVMYYHSTEPNHIHFHPFEAVRAGMPLIFMAGGLLDKVGGLGLWGRCESIEQARSKVKQVLKDEGALIKTIQHEQTRLLNCMNPDYCNTYFNTAYKKIIHELTTAREAKDNSSARKVVVLLPVEYRGGSLRGAILLANSLINGADFLHDRVDVVLAYLDISGHYPDNLFDDLDSRISRRPYQWKLLDAGDAKRAMAYAGYPNWVPVESQYQVPDDGINQFLDCDLWLIISDRMEGSLLPIRPNVLMVYDYIQRYIPFLPQSTVQQLLGNAHQAACVLTTTQFTANDTMQYAGLNASKVLKMPMLVPDFKEPAIDASVDEISTYFIWTTNRAFHKNHLNTFEALYIYYEELGGTLECHITGVGSGELLKIHTNLNNILNRSLLMQNNIKFCNELSELAYKKKLKRAAFLLHSASIDNGTFSVIEAAQCGIPSLSCDYPPMREINERFNLDLSWMDGMDPYDMAANFKKMEKSQAQLKEKIAKKDKRQFMHTHDEEVSYWEVIKSCL